MQEDESSTCCMRSLKAESDAFEEAVKASLKTATQRGSYFAPLELRSSSHHGSLSDSSPLNIGELQSNFGESPDAPSVASSYLSKSTIQQASPSSLPMGGSISNLKQWAKKILKPSSWSRHVVAGSTTSENDSSKAVIESINEDSYVIPYQKYGFGKASCNNAEIGFGRVSCENVQVGFGRSSCSVVHTDSVFDTDSTSFHRSSISPWHDDLKARSVEGGCTAADHNLSN
jgi:hypothetical protein